MIEAEHLTKRYDRALVVDGVSLSPPASRRSCR